MKTIRFSKINLDWKLLNFISILFLFLFIYSPNFILLPINISYLIILLSISYVSFGNNLGRLLSIFKHREFFTYIVFFMLSIAYILLVPIITESVFDKTFLITYIRLLLDIVLVLPVFVLIFCHDLDYSTEDFLNLLVKIGVIQAVIASLMFVMPGLKIFVFNYLIELPSEKLVSQTYRGYGISNDFYFSSPLFQGLVFVVNSILYIKTSNRKYLYYYPFILLSLFINARITILVLPVFFAVIFCLSFYYDDLRWLQKLSGLFLFFLWVLSFIGIYFLFNPEKMESLIWIVEGVLGGIGALSGNILESKTLTIMFREHLHLPQRVSQLWLGPSSPLRSDLGYIRYIYFGGILFSAISYFSIINFSLNRIIKSKDSLFKALIWTLLVTTFVVHMKGDILNSSAFLRGFLLILILSIYNFKSFSFNEG